MLKVGILSCVIFLLLLQGNLVGEPWALKSAVRYKGETFEKAEARYLRNLRRYAPPRGGTAYDAAVPFDKLDFSKVTMWENGELDETFKKVRDERFLIHPSKPNFLRRESWLYPHDGCFARAALAGQRIEKWKIKRPAKIFIFGGLTVSTPNAKEGSVSWWYHVVPINLDGRREPFVLDPAIDPKEPLELKEWILTMTSATEEVKLSVCNPYTYSPSSRCLDALPPDDSGAEQDQMHYLSAEWSNLVYLNRNPERELGDYPPWLERSDRDLLAFLGADNFYRPITF